MVIAMNDDQVVRMLDSSVESDIDEDPDFLLPHDSHSEEESLEAPRSELSGIKYLNFT